MARILVSLALALTLASSPAQPPFEFTSYTVVLNSEDPCCELISGEWTLTKPGGLYSTFRWEISGPGTGAGQARWIAEDLLPGTYRIDIWITNGDFPTDAQWQVIGAAGLADLNVDMNFEPTGWLSLGEFSVDRVCVVNVSDLWTGGGSTLPIDAVRFTLTSPVPDLPSSPYPPHIGICIDDVGSVDPTVSSTPIHDMLRLPFPMTYAVLPHRTYTAESAEEIHRLGSEVILHQPMAAISVPNPGTGGITDAMTLAQVRATVSANLEALPHCVGMNNHMGSLITQQSDKMGVCVEEAMARGMWFLDSRTITTSVAYDVAQDMGCFSAERDLFIDGGGQAESMALIRSLAVRALAAPDVPHLAIGHVRSGTAEALEAMVPELEAMGVEVWPISRCVTQVIEVDQIPAGCAVITAGDWASDTDDALSKSLRDGHALVAEADGSHSATFTPAIPWDGQYDVCAIWRGNPLGAPDTTAVMSHARGVTQIAVDQSATSDRWVNMGRFNLLAGQDASLTLGDPGASSEGMLRADAVRFVHRGPLAEGSTGLLLH